MGELFAAIITILVICVLYKICTFLLNRYTKISFPSPKVESLLAQTLKIFIIFNICLVVLGWFGYIIEYNVMSTLIIIATIYVFVYLASKFDSR